MTASGRLRRFCGFCGMSAYPPKLTVEADIPDQTASCGVVQCVAGNAGRCQRARLGSLRLAGLDLVDSI
jgi:hypothetical protein